MPQNVQNIMIRGYGNNRDLHYLLSAAEYAIQNCYMVLKDLASESKKLSGIVLYSAYQLPEDTKVRNDICKSIVSNDCAIHFCAEDMVINSVSELEKVNIILDIHKTLTSCKSKI